MMVDMRHIRGIFLCLVEDCRYGSLGNASFQLSVISYQLSAFSVISFFSYQLFQLSVPFAEVKDLRFYFLVRSWELEVKRFAAIIAWVGFPSEVRSCDLTQENLSSTTQFFSFSEAPGRWKLFFE
ncbi:MAG: hypothetical protein F6K40_16450 [Okeania sp. SIO3I5]|uniref:hypothetical protein n=1 Tax=Okeania sp. SIO3I5 TaxID=2607805 RepID=UPI0013B8E66D|nr:hypothetical protein [Okeania sp. SIO3I5]NEQ37767.1 hypothetical protein [Okeania sp. SIO3I5]